MEVTIRKETVDDYRAVFDLNAGTFSRDNESKLIEALRKGDAFVPELSLVAEKKGQIVGHIFFSKIRIVGDAVHESLALAPVAVSSDMQRQGIGSMLVEAGLKRATEIGFDSVIVLGHEDYYPRFGFRLASEWNITTEYNSPESTFAIELTKGGLKGVSGVVSYPGEFVIVG